MRLTHDQQEMILAALTGLVRDIDAAKVKIPLYSDQLIKERCKVLELLGLFVDDDAKIDIVRAER